jgi:uncharacterized protein YjbI with pentapeptide repeats
MQGYHAGLGITLAIFMFTLFEAGLLLSQLKQPSLLETEIKEFKKGISGLSDKNQKIKKIEFKKEAIDFEIKKINILNDVLGARFQLFGGLFLVVTAYFSWQTLTILREKQITELLGKAIEHIGNAESLEIRLGGIYTLERIARDSNKYFWQVIEILVAYIKERRSIISNICKIDSDSSTLVREQFLPQDVQAALKVIARRMVSQDPHNFEIDLSLCSFNNICLTEARFNRVNFSGTSFKDSDLSSSRFLYSILSNSNFSSANLSSTNFRYATLANAIFYNANLENADFKKAKFNEVDLEGADLSNAILEGVDLSKVTGLTQFQINSALTDSKTILPSYLLGKKS